MNSSDHNNKPELGFGCMGFSAFYSSAKETSVESAREVILKALDLGVRVFNSATFYGDLNEKGYGENLRLLGECFKGVPRESYELMVKIGMDTRCPVEKTGTYFEMKGDEESIRKDVQYALDQLQTDYLDIAVLCRVPRNCEIEETISTLLKLKEEKKIRHIGLSEASIQTLRRVKKLTDIYCIEQEYSLFSRDIEENNYLKSLREEIQIKKLFAYSPLGKGFFSNQFPSFEDLRNTNDFRVNLVPKLSNEENFLFYQEKFLTVKRIAEKYNISTGQVSLLWLLIKGKENNFDIVPIPGTTKVNHLIENMKVLDIYTANPDLFEEEDLKTLDETFAPEILVGERYSHYEQTFKYN